MRPPRVPQTERMGQIWLLLCDQDEAVTSHAIAEAIGLTAEWTQRCLARMARRGYALKVGEQEGTRHRLWAALEKGPPGAPPPPKRERHKYQRSPWRAANQQTLDAALPRRCVKTYRWLRENSLADTPMVADALGVCPETARQYLKRLRREGLVASKVISGKGAPVLWEVA